MAPHRTVYVTQRASVHQQVARAASPEQLDLVMLVSPSAEEIADAVAASEFLVSERSGIIDASIIDAGRKLRLIQRLGLQIHDIDLEAAQRAQIPVCRWPLAQSAMVAEHVVMQIMALLKRTREGAQIVAETSEQWGPPRRCDADTFAIDWSQMTGVRQLQDCTVGIVGLGEIGDRVGAPASAASAASCSTIVGTGCRAGLRSACTSPTPASTICWAAATWWCCSCLILSTRLASSMPDSCAVCGRAPS